MGPPFDLTVTEDGFRFGFADAIIAHYARKLFVAYIQGQVEVGSDLFAVELVFGELIGNVVRHAPGPVDVRVSWGATGARLEVWDHGPGYEPAVTLPEDALSESHRGLFVVASYGNDLCVERRGAQTVTTVRLRIQRAVPHRVG